jgi:hypothetical protein
MSTTPTPPTFLDAALILQRLDSQTIINRLAELDAEQRSLRVLLRSVRAREQALARKSRDGRPTPPAGGGGHAA